MPCPLAPAPWTVAPSIMRRQAVSRQAAMWWATEFAGQSFMAVGTLDPVLGPKVMERMRQIIKGCPEPMLLEAGHFVQEHGEPVARAALAEWGLA